MRQGAAVAYTNVRTHGLNRQSSGRDRVGDLRFGLDVFQPVRAILLLWGLAFLPGADSCRAAKSAGATELSARGLSFGQPGRAQAERYPSVSHDRDSTDSCLPTAAACWTPSAATRSKG